MKRGKPPVNMAAWRLCKAVSEVQNMGKRPKLLNSKKAEPGNEQAMTIN